MNSQKVTNFETEKTKVRLFDIYRSYLTSLNRVENTIEQVIDYLGYFEKFLQANDSTFEQADEHLVIKYRRGLFQRGLKPRTVEHYTRAVLSFYNWLELTNRIFINPCPVDYVICSKPNGEPIVLSVDQIQRLFDSIPNKRFTNIRFKAQLKLLYGTGVRKSELLSLTMKSINLKDYKVRFMGKNKKEAVLPLTQSAVDALQEYLNVRDLYNPENIDALWLSRAGTKHSKANFGTDVNYWRKKTQIRFCAHTFRRSMASHCLANGMNPFILSEFILRHESIKTLSRYLNIPLSDIINTHNQMKEIQS